MALDPETIGTLFAGVSLIGGGVGWAVRSYVNTEISAVKSKLDIHLAEDTLIHQHVNEKLDDIKQDMLDLKQHFGVKSNGKSPSPLA